MDSRPPWTEGSHEAMLKTDAFRKHCEADRRCGRAACFEAQLEARDGGHRVRKNAELCANHLGDMVQSLTAWAREEGITCGQVTVLVIDPCCPRTITRTFEFAAIPLT
jgi:hypothetical protein